MFSEYIIKDGGEASLNTVSEVEVNIFGSEFILEFCRQVEQMVFIYNAGSHLS